MEVDVSSIDERKESSDGALLRLHELTEAAADSMLIDFESPNHGQLMISSLRQNTPSCNSHYSMLLSAAHLSV